MKQPKKVNKVLQIVDPDVEYEYEANEVSRHSPTALRAKSITFPPVVGRGIRNIYDAGSNVFIAPHVPYMLLEATTTPVHEKVQVADNSFRPLLESPPLEEPSSA